MPNQPQKSQSPGIIEHASVAYWDRSVVRSSPDYHLNQIDKDFRELAETLGYRVEKIEEPSEPVEAPDPDYRGEPPALKSGVVRGNLQAGERG